MNHRNMDLVRELKEIMGEQFNENLDMLEEKYKPVQIVNLYLSLYKMMLLTSKGDEEIASREDHYEKLVEAIDQCCILQQENTEVANLYSFMQCVFTVQDSGLEDQAIWKKLAKAMDPHIHFMGYKDLNKVNFLFKNLNAGGSHFLYNKIQVKIGQQFNLLNETTETIGFADVSHILRMSLFL